jgi:hypothetical protein
MKFVTVATDSRWYFEYLIQSAHRHNIPLEILGWGEHFQGWVWRMKLLLSYFAKQKPDEIICFLDAYDVIFLQDATVIEKRFKEIGARVVVAEDYNVDPFMEFVARRYIFGTCKKVRVNAGTYIGYAGDILAMLTTMCEENSCLTRQDLDDQKMLTELCQKQPNRFHIDTQKRIFLCICFKTGMDDAGIDVVDKKLMYKKKIDPCILHGAGNANMDEVILKLGYKLTESHQKQSINMFMYPVIIAVIILLILTGVVARATFRTIAK